MTDDERARLYIVMVELAHIIDKKGEAEALARRDPVWANALNDARLLYGNPHEMEPTGISPGGVRPLSRKGKKK